MHSKNVNIDMLRRGWVITENGIPKHWNLLEGNAETMRHRLTWDYQENIYQLRRFADGDEQYNLKTIQVEGVPYILTAQ